MVIQEQSHTPITNREAFFDGARKLVAKIRANGATPILYSTWGRKEGNKDIATFNLENNEVMTYKLAAAYQQIGKELDVPVAHVGLAFYEIYTSTDIAIYHSDGSHPSNTGSYLAALTIFSKIFNVLAIDVPYSPTAMSSSDVSALKTAANKVVFEAPQNPEKYLS